MTQDELKIILAEHAAWLADNTKGKCANLEGADLEGASLKGADLKGVSYVIILGQPNGWFAFAYLWEGAIWVRVGCRTKSITDGRAYWAGKEGRREVLAALDYAETIARLRGWEFTI